MHAEFLRDDLDRLVLRARPRLRAYSLRKAFAGSLERAAITLLFVPAMLLGSQLLAAAGMHSPPFPSLPLAIAASLAPPLLYLGWSLARAYCRAAVERSIALSLYDRQLNLNDRLVTAEEFLTLEQADAFSAAAIEDAASFVSAARQAPLDAIARHLAKPRARTGWYVGGAVAIFLLAAGLNAWREAPGARGDLSAASGTNGALMMRVPIEDTRPGSAIRRTRVRGVARSAAEASTDSIAERMSARTAESPAAGAGIPGSSAASGAASGSGHPQAGGAGERPQSPGRKDAAEQTSAPSAPSGSPGGSGAGQPGQNGASGAGNGGSAGDRGAGGSGTDSEAAGEELSAKDGNPGNSAAGTREGAAAESEKTPGKQARSGAGSPSEAARNAQKGSSSRDASGSPAAGGAQGEGQGGSPGSKSGEKKSRGVASLILGEPLPDRIQGQPTAGPVRTTQQQVAPRPEPAGAAHAQQRDPRGTPMQPVPRTQPPPWMQALIERYFNRQDGGREP